MTTKTKQVNLDIDGKIINVKMILELQYATEAYGPGGTLTRDLNRFKVLVNDELKYESPTFRGVVEDDALVSAIQDAEKKVKKDLNKLYKVRVQKTLDDILKEKGYE